jgi:hypothetical protein
MKLKILKFVLGAIILCSFSLQALTPPLPNTSIVSISGLTWWEGSQSHTYYAAKVVAGGPIMTDYSQRYQSSEIIVNLPRSTEWFQTNYQYYYTSTFLYTWVHVYVKKTSTSQWTFLYSSDTDHDCIKSVVDNYMHDLQFDASEAAPIEE